MTQRQTVRSSLVGFKFNSTCYGYFLTSAYFPDYYSKYDCFIAHNNFRLDLTKSSVNAVSATKSGGKRLCHEAKQTALLPLRP